MRIAAIHVANFKGLDNATEVRLRPLTFLFGANSSGKSTCIHALAALSQSIKLPNNTRAITLDDEFAYVHLGRFIEAMHSKSYGDAITLGLTIEDAHYLGFGQSLSDKPNTQPSKGVVHADYAFRSTMRTQDVSVASADLSGGTDQFRLRPQGKVKDRYSLTNTATKDVLSLNRRTAFIFDFEAQSLTPASLEVVIAFQSVQGVVRQALDATKYLGPFRQPPLRRYPTRGSGPTDVGPQGEATVTMLANESVQRQKRAHVREISDWIAQLGLGRDIEVPRISTSDLFETNVTLPDGKKFALADLGYGLSQVLPVLTQCSFAEANSTLLFEQPELHLHPVAAGKLTNVFCETVKKGVTIVAETHSPEMVKQALRAIRGKRISREDVAIYKASRRKGRTEIEPIEIDDEGDVYENWGLGVSAEIPGVAETD